MVRFFKHQLVVIGTFLSGLYFLLEFALPNTFKDYLIPNFTGFHERVSYGFILMGALAIGLALLNILRVHGGNIVRRRRGALNSAALLIGMFAVFGIEGVNLISNESQTQALERLLIIGKTKEGTSSKRTIDFLSKQSEIFFTTLVSLQGHGVIPTYSQELETARSSVKSLIDSLPNSPVPLSNDMTIILSNKITSLAPTLRKLVEHSRNSRTTTKLSTFIFNGLFVPLGSAMFSLLAFYIATAAYRTFRIRSVEAGVMMLTAVIVILGQIPQGPLYIAEGLPTWRLWILENISTPAFRAIGLGSSIAGLGLAVRILFSLGSSPLASDISEDET